MARSIYNIDFDAFVQHRHILGEDSDSPFPLQVVVVKYQLSEIFRLAYKVRLINHPVHESGLAVVYVGDNRNVPYFLHILLESRKVTDFRGKS